MQTKIPAIKRILFFVLLIVWSSVLNAQNTLDNLSLTGATPSAVSYSLRQTSTSYIGSAIRVRRSSDNTEQDIGFSGGTLDQASLLAFVGAGNGFVTVWYDQSGFGRNATQTTLANQPRIVNAGVVETQNGKPAIFLNGTNSYLRQTTLAVSNPYSLNVVASRTASNGGYQRLIWLR